MSPRTASVQNAPPSASGLTPVARLDELKGDGPFALSVGQEDLVGVRVGDAVKVYGGRCPHQGALLGEGEIEGGALVCRNHRWKFDAATGQRLGGRECLKACRSELRDGVLLVDLASLAGDAAADGRRLRALSDLPSPRGLPLVGSLFDLEPARLHEVLEGFARGQGDLFRLKVGPKSVLVVADSALSTQVLRERPERYRRLSVLERVFRELEVHGVFSAEGKDWRPLRRLTMHALSNQHVRGFYPTMAKVAERLHGRWAKAADAGGETDLLEDLKRFTVDVTMLLAFGHDANTLESDDDVIQRKLELFFPALSRRITALIPWWRIVKTPAERRVEAGLADIFKWLDGLVSEARVRLEEDPSRALHPTNFLEAMLAARDDEGRPFSNEDVLANCLQILVAGEDTTSHTLAWAAHESCERGDVWERLAHEADGVLGDARVPPTLDAAGRLDYAAAVANETMRLRPVAPMLFLEANVDTELADVAVPKGTPVFALLRPGAKDARHFGDPGAFRPERWTEAGALTPHDPAAHLPFGSGPRICPGRTLAMLEMKVVLATLAKSFRLERVGRRDEVSEHFSFTMMPSGIRMRIRRR